jgi:hypothetical protein
MTRDKLNPACKDCRAFANRRRYRQTLGIIDPTRAKDDIVEMNVHVQNDQCISLGLLRAQSKPSFIAYHIPTRSIATLTVDVDLGTERVILTPAESTRASVLVNSLGDQVGFKATVLKWLIDQDYRLEKDELGLHNSTTLLYY